MRKKVTMLKRVEKLFVQLNGAAVALMMFTMFILVFMNVITRYVFGFSLNWSDELSRFLMIWTVFLGAGLAMREGRHVAIEFLQSMLPDKLQKYFRATVGLIIIAFMGVLVILGYSYADAMMATKSPVLRWPIGLVYIVIPIGALAFILHFVTIFRDYLEKTSQEEQIDTELADINTEVHKEQRR
jgi:TRAP-type C4-dicarboxylate transport system permease small subunit